MSDRFPILTASAQPAAAGRLPIGRILLRNRVLTECQLQHAIGLQSRLHLRLGDLCIAQGFASPQQIARALAEQNGLAEADLARDPPDRRLLAIRPARFWLRHRAVPQALAGGCLTIATSRPDDLEALSRGLRSSFSHITPALADEAQLLSFLSRHCGGELAERASLRQRDAPGRRALTARRIKWAGLAVAAALAAGTAAAPQLALAVLSVTALAALLMFFLLRAAGLAAYLAAGRRRCRTHPGAKSEPRRLPRISVLVPLFREQHIAGHLIRRLARLTYPPALLDVVLVLEAHDDLTRATIARSRLPRWMRTVEVPAHGGLTTKPRAMNYALDFCHGDIIGVWDAEDAPAPDQLQRVARRFHQAGEEVACLQGVLDYYNPRANWIARCFTIEYASWFRVIMPGLERLGLVLPLGGTTMFIRRAALEALGRWDAHNVTEDADLGVRIARAGLKTEMLDTTTYEEANCRPWPWVRQRSR